MAAKTPVFRAYCYASGLIEFGEQVPDGALPIAKGPEPILREFFKTHARHGYTTKIVKGRPTKIPGTETLLVPGVPEAPDQGAGLDALHAFIAWIKPAARAAGVELHASPLISTVRPQRHRAKQAGA